MSIRKAVCNSQIVAYVSVRFGHFISFFRIWQIFISSFVYVCNRTYISEKVFLIKKLSKRKCLPTMFMNGPLIQFIRCYFIHQFWFDMLYLSTHTHTTISCQSNTTSRMVITSIYLSLICRKFFHFFYMLLTLFRLNSRQTYGAE